MADKPARALIIYGDGVMPALGSSHTHLHALASRGCCGFLALRDLPPQLSEDERLIRELAQLVDVHDLCYKENLTQNLSNTLGHVSGDCKGNASGDCQGHVIFPSMEERFMGMKAAMVTNSGIANAFGKKAGFSITALHELCNKSGFSDESEEPPDPFSAASELLHMLGLQEEAVVQSSKFDLVFLHIGSSLKTREAGNGNVNAELAIALEWINALVGRIMEIIQPGSVAASRLYVSLVLSYGSVSFDKTDDSSLLINLEEISPTLASLLPCQSYTIKGGKPLNDVRHHHPMLAVKYQEAVTRCDEAKIFSFEEFQEHGGDRAILADSFLYEIAFKIWKSPKYGA